MTHDGPESPSAKSLLVMPALVTLAVTLLRLTGELRGWSPTFFARDAGGAAAIVGIVWLVPIFGIYFAWKLARSGPAPGAGRVVGHALLAFSLVVASALIAVRVFKLDQNAQFLVVFLACGVATWVAYRGWPVLGRTLLAYGVAARVPVMVVMLVAIFANWGTHYDVPPPDFPEMGALRKWFFIGFLPQAFLWIPFTVFAGALCGGIALLFAGRARQSVAA